MVEQLQGLDTRGRSIIEGLIEQQRAVTSSNRREVERDEFIVPVKILDIETRQTLFSTLAVDMSALGIRLVHQGEEMEPGEYILSLQPDESSPIAIRSVFEWCLSCGNGWYSSGWNFVSISR